MKKVNDQDIKKAVEQYGNDTQTIAKVLGLSYSNTRYRIRKLEQSGQKTADQRPQETRPEPKPEHKKQDARLDQVTEHKKTGHIVTLLKSDIDTEKLTPDVDSQYHYRYIDQLIDRYGQRNVPVVLIGEAGTGKTHAVRQYASKKSLPFLRVACDDSAVLKEFIGRREIINGTTYFRTGLLVELLQRPSVILFDEFNALNASRLFFLHELLDNRRIFLKDADEGKIINVHADCKIFLACNYNNARYVGTNRINVALADRCVTVDVPLFNIEDLDTVFDTGRDDMTQALKRFYVDTLRVIREQNLRLVFSIRAVRRIVEGIRKGDDIRDAVKYGFYNVAIATATVKERDAIEQIARVCFGMNETPDVEQEGADL
ncbi:MAG: AAA family ATPase [Promethearchaeota archaeon]